MEWSKYIGKYFDSIGAHDDLLVLLLESNFYAFYVVYLTYSYLCAFLATTGKENTISYSLQWYHFISITVSNDVWITVSGKSPSVAEVLGLCITYIMASKITISIKSPVNVYSTSHRFFYPYIWVLLYQYLAVREITKSSCTFSATNISGNLVWLLSLHDTIQTKSNLVTKLSSIYLANGDKRLAFFVNLNIIC